MEVEKKRSKGGFLQLFDWNGKSRKKLFSNNSELHDEPKKGKENVGNMAKSLLHVIEVDESRASSSNKGSSEFNCASSVTSDEGYGTRAPGVVARLMGLDSLPTSNVVEPSSTSYFDMPSLRASHHDKSTPNLGRNENHHEDFLNVPSKEWFYGNPVESRVRKVHNRSIERFQTEMLPPKSAKSIPVTHNKMLSPIKNPGFITTKNTAHIMEAAAKIIEASPQATSKGKRPTVVPSVPLRIWDLREKMEAAHRTSRPQKSNEPLAARYTKGQNSDQSRCKPDRVQAVQASMNLEKRSSDMRKKGKSVSLAVQGKVNVEKRDGSTSSSNRNSMNQKEKSDAKTNQFLKSQRDTPRTVQKGTSANRNNNVLRQNTQKQNYISNRDGSTSKTSVSNQQGKNAQSVSGGSIRPSRAVSKVVANSGIGSERTGSTTSDTGKKLSSFKAKNLSQKKLSVNEVSQFQERVADCKLTKKDERSIKCNVATDGCMNWGTDNRKKGMDVVSFTFSSPIRSQSSGQVMEKNNSFKIDSSGDNNQRHFESSTFPSPAFNAIGGDALSILLEQKLKELTCKVESSHCNVIREGTTSSASSLQDSVSTLGIVNTNSEEHDKKFQLCLDKDISDSLDDSCCTSIGSQDFKINQKWQFRQSEEMEKHSSSSNNHGTERELDFQHCSPVSSRESSFTSLSCSDNRNNTGDSKQFSMAEDQVDFSWLSTNASLSVDGEIELSESASSILDDNISKKHTTRASSLVDGKESSNWEFDYVGEILDNADLMINDFALDQTHRHVISSSLFSQLENQKNETETNEEELLKLERRVLFDCVCERLDSKCQQLLFGSCNGWGKLTALFQRKRDSLAEELYKEILALKSMGDLMVDEIVEKDMSSQYGRWVDFDIEAFEEGVEIENEILTCLVDELVSDFLLV